MRRQRSLVLVAVGQERRSELGRGTAVAISAALAGLTLAPGTTVVAITARRATVTAAAAAFAARATIAIAAASAATMAVAASFALGAAVAALTRFARGTGVGQLLAGFLVDEPHRE